MSTEPRAQKIAIIGSGIAGLSCAWHLHNTGHQVTVYAGGDHVGGHSHTHVTQTRDGKAVPVDTGFIVFNERTYPNLIQLFKALKVPVKKSDMSFGVSLDDGGYEYSGSTLLSLFAQPANFFRPAHWRMIRDIMRFYKEAPKLLEQAESPTLGDYLKAGNYSESFIHRHLIPMGAAIWSTPAGEMMQFPATTFVRFCQNHGLLSVSNRPQWWTVDGGSVEYVKRLTAAFAHRIRRTAATRVRHLQGGVLVEAEGSYAQFDQVVFACHADEALALLVDPAPELAGVLGSFRFQANRAVLHQDDALMPVRDRAWASWNVLSFEQGISASAPIALTYWMNNLQSIDDDKPLFVTLNPPQEPLPELTIFSTTYMHPIFDSAAINAQQYLRYVQGQQGLWFCGAWTGYGFHEDGATSGLTVAEAISGMARPWQVQEMSTAAYNVWPVSWQQQQAAA